MERGILGGASTSLYSKSEGTSGRRAGRVTYLRDSTGFGSLLFSVIECRQMSSQERRGSKKKKGGREMLITGKYYHGI